MVPSDGENTTDEDVTKLQKSRVTKKKSFFNLINHLGLNQKIQNNHETKFPLVKKSIGFFRVIDSEPSDSESDISEIISSIENENKKRSSVPWHLLHAEPTRPEDIDDGLILDKILKSRERMKAEEIKKMKCQPMKYFIRMLQNIEESFKKTKNINKHKKRIRIIEGLLPEEEYAEIKKQYLEKNRISQNSAADN